MGNTHSHDAVITTPQGTLRGRWRLTTDPNARSAAFLGVPVSAPPVDDLRYAAPVPVPAWDGVRDATEFGATAQRGDPGVTLIPEPSVPGNATLNVNVFTPNPDASAQLPVIAYVHGGGFVAGSPASTWYDGAAFNRDGVVTVTLSYRLGFDGFGVLPDAPNNRAILDLLAGLRWVQANIAAYGGDPHNVTLMGQSAGGGLALTLLGMAEAQPFFERVVAISPALGDVTLTRATAVTTKLARRLGVAPTRSGFSSVSEDKVIAAQSKAAVPPLREMLESGLALAPVIDGDVIPQSVPAAIAAGIGSEKPLLMTATEEEFAMLADKLPAITRVIPGWIVLSVLGVSRARRSRYFDTLDDARKSDTRELLGSYVTDAVFRRTVARVADARRSAPTWVASFAEPAESFGRAVHCSDVPFIFDVLADPGVTALLGGSPAQDLATRIHDHIVAFAQGEAPHWVAWSVQTGSAERWLSPLPLATTTDAYARASALLNS